MDTISSLTDVRAHLPAMLRKLRTGRRHRVIITRNGRPAAVLMSPEEVETLEVLADRDLMVSLLKAEGQARSGKLLRHDEVFH